MSEEKKDEREETNRVKLTLLALLILWTISSGARL